MDLLINVNSYNADKNFPHFAKPEEVDAFSLNCEKMEVYQDKSYLKFFHLPTTPQFQFDLNQGYESYNDACTDRDNTPRLDNFLRWILLLKNRKNDLNLKQICFNADFISWRGLMTKIALTPYEKREGWIVCVTKYKDIYFLCEFETDKKKEQKLKLTAREQLMTYWGHSFERYVTKPLDAQADACQSPVNTDEQYCSVVRTKLGDHRLLFGGEVDCLDVETNKYLELKTSRHIETDRQNINFIKFKILKWWLQSFLIGINRIVCGFRDDDGRVTKITDYNVHELPRQANGHWSGAVCFNFLHDFLSIIKKNVTENNSKKIYKFEFNPCTHKIRMADVDPSTNEILRDWFVEETSKF